MTWPALAAARAGTPQARLPFFAGAVRVGSVARVHLGALREWPQALRLDEDRVTLIARDRNAALAAINAALRRQGLIRAWRDETFAVFDPATRAPLARMERAASRFWGTLTLGAHATGYVRGPSGRIERLWIAQRAFSKPTDPGLFDNLVGGGVPAGQTPLQALVREGFEEAGLSPAQMQAACAGSVIRLERDIPEGHQLEDLHSFDLALPAGLQPQNQDGEVQAFSCLAVPDAVALAAGSRMTVDASLVTLDFLLRHGLLPADTAPTLTRALQRLFAPPADRDQIA